MKISLEIEQFQIYDSPLIFDTLINIRLLLMISDVTFQTYLKNEVLMQSFT